MLKIKIIEELEPELVRLLDEATHEQHLVILRYLIKRSAIKSYIKELRLHEISSRTGLSIG